MDSTLRPRFTPVKPRFLYRKGGASGGARRSDLTRCRRAHKFNANLFKAQLDETSYVTSQKTRVFSRLLQKTSETQSLRFRYVLDLETGLARHSYSAPALAVSGTQNTADIIS